MIPDTRIERDIRAMLVVAERTAHEGDGYTPDDFGIDDIDDIDEAVDLWRAAERQAAAARAVVEAAGIQLAELLGDGGAARIGPSIVRYRVASKERCVDPDGWSAVMTARIVDGDITAGDVVNPNSAKKGSMTAAVRDTFYTRDYDDHPSLAVMPVDKSPKFLQALAEGETILGTRP